MMEYNIIRSKEIKAQGTRKSWQCNKEYQLLLISLEYLKLQIYKISMENYKLVDHFGDYFRGIET